MAIDFSSFIDVKIAILLWCVGYAIKHLKFKFFKNIPNDSIPIMLFGIGIVGSCIEAGDVSMNAIIIGIITAGFAVGIHSSGKNIFKLAENTTVYATPDSISNSTAKQEKQKKEYINSDNYIETPTYEEEIPDSETLGDGEIILDVPEDTGSSVG